MKHIKIFLFILFSFYIKNKTYLISNVNNIFLNNNSYNIEIKLTGALIENNNIKIKENGIIKVIPKKNYVFDNARCESSNIEYLKNNIFKVTNLKDDICIINYKEIYEKFNYDPTPREYISKYDGYYLVNASGSQGDGSGGKGALVSFYIYLKKEDKLTINTGGQREYNGGGRGFYSGGGATIISKNDEVIVIASGGGGGKGGGPGGSGNAKGGESSGGIYANGGSGNDGINGGGGGAGYNYEYNSNCSTCYSGNNTCSGTVIKYNCSECYKGENTCTAGNKKINCSSCHSGENTCTYGCDVYYDNCINGKCDEIYYNCSSCYSGENTCVYGCDIVYDECISGQNTCAYGCDTYVEECKQGENTCEYGCDTNIREYNPGSGGKNVINAPAILIKEIDGYNAGNGKAEISYYKES